MSDSDSEISEANWEDGETEGSISEAEFQDHSTEEDFDSSQINSNDSNDEDSGVDVVVFNTKSSSDESTSTSTSTSNESEEEDVAHERYESEESEGEEEDEDIVEFEKEEEEEPRDYEVTNFEDESSDSEDEEFESSPKKKKKSKRTPAELLFKILKAIQNLIDLGRKIREGQNFFDILRVLSVVIDFDILTKRIDSVTSIKVVPKERSLECTTLLSKLYHHDKEFPGAPVPSNMKKRIENLMLFFHEDYGLYRRKLGKESQKREKKLGKIFLKVPIEEIVRRKYIKVVRKFSIKNLKDRMDNESVSKYFGPITKFRVDEDKEDRIELEKYRKDDNQRLKKEVRRTMERMEFLPTRYLGGGVSGQVLSGCFKNLIGHFAIKFVDLMLDKSFKKRKDTLDRDFLKNVDFHPNIIQPIERYFSTIDGKELKKINQFIDLYDLSDDDNNENYDFGMLINMINDDDWIPLEFTKNKGVGIVLMKDKNNSLLEYLLRRLEKIKEGQFEYYFSDLELSIILKRLLCGLHHLQENRIVHRDLHLGNVLVKPEYGEVYIIDFGCSLDMKNKKKYRTKKNNPFAVRREDLMECDISFSSEYLNRGGASSFLPPEVNYDDENVNKKYLDYSSSDLYSIGMIMRTIIQSQFNLQRNKCFQSKKRKLGTISLEDDLVEVSRRHKVVGERYQPSERILRLVDMMTKEKGRIHYQEALREVNAIIKKKRPKKKKMKKHRKVYKDIFDGDYYFIREEYKEAVKFILEVIDESEEFEKIEKLLKRLNRTQWNVIEIGKILLEGGDDDLISRFVQIFYEEKLNLLNLVL